MKTKHLFITVLLLAATLLAATNSFASPPYPGPGRSWFAPGGEKIKLFSNEEFFSKADYIIEADFAGMEYISYYDAGGNYNPDEFYTSTFLIVTRVYKNDETMPVSRRDTLHQISKGGAVIKPWSSLQEKEQHPFEEGEQIRTPYPEDYDTGERGYAGGGILFMKKSDFPENPDISKRSKYPKVSMLQDIPRATIKIGAEFYAGEIDGLNGLHFENRYELYKYMEQFEGVTVPQLSDPGLMHRYLDDKTFDQYLKERNVEDPRIPRTPQPATQPCIFAINSENTVTLKIYSLVGKEIFSQVATGQTEIDLSRYLPIGVYIAVVFSEEKRIETRKIMVE